MLDLLLLHVFLTVQIIHEVHPIRCLVSKQRIVLPIQLLLRLLLNDLHAERLASLRLISHIVIPAPLALLRFFGLPLGHLLEHELFIALRRGSNVTPLGLVIAQRLQLLFIAQLEVLHLHEMLRAALLVLIEFT